MAKGNPLDQYSPMQSAIALLQPTVSYAQKRADAMANLQIQGAITQQSQQQLEVAKQQSLLAQQQQAALMNVPFLEADQKRWVAELDRGKAKLRKRAEEEFGGDVEEYAKTLLEQDIQQFALEMQKSPLYAAALERRSNFLQAQKDAAGKIYRPVQYKLANGQTKVAPFDQAYLDFASGETEELPYRGGFKVDGEWREHFDKVYSPRAGQLGRYKPDVATESEIASALVGIEGLTGEDAQEYMRRTRGMLSPVYYKVDAIDPLEVERINQGWANVGLNKQRVAQGWASVNQRRQALDRKQKQDNERIDAFDFTFRPDNVETRNADGSPRPVPATFFDPKMKPEDSISLLHFDGRWLGDSFLQSTGARKDEKTGRYTGAGGFAYVAAKNNSGGIDLRATDLTGLKYETIPGDIFRYQAKKPGLYRESTGQAPYKYMQEQTIRISSDEAKKARDGHLFRTIIPGMENFESGFLGNIDTPTGKGAYRDVGEHVDKDGRKKHYYEFKVLQLVKPTAIDRLQPTLDRMNTQTPTGQAVLRGTNNDLEYFYGFDMENDDSDHIP